MTINEKEQLNQYIDYLEAKGIDSRKSSRKPGLAQFISGWLAGSGEIRKNVANDLRAFIEYAEAHETDAEKPVKQAEGTLQVKKTPETEKPAMTGKSADSDLLKGELNYKFSKILKIFNII